MGRSIEIPLHNQDEVLIIGLNPAMRDTDDLGATQQEDETILTILTNERVPLALYLEFAREFHKKGIFDFAEKALQKGAERGQNRHFIDAKLGYHLKLLETIGAAENIRDKDYLKIITSLSIHYTELAASITTTSDPAQQAQRTAYVSKATEYLNKADNLDDRNVWTAIAKGNMYLLNSKVSEANKVFTYAVDEESNNMAALIGLAACHYRSQDFKTALKLYQKILVLDPKIQPDPRIAIGICYHRLQMHNEAQASFKRALELNPKNSDALALVARMEWNQAREEGSVDLLEDAVKRIKDAWNADFKNGSVLNLVAEGLFFRGQFDKVEAVVKSALENTGSASVKAESYGILAKSYHTQGLYKEATEMYSKALALNPTSITFQYGLGQMFIHSGDCNKSLECFEKVLAKDGENIEVLKKLASVSSDQPKHVEKSLKYFGKLLALIKSFQEDSTEPSKRVLEKDQIGIFPDPMMQVELARLYEAINPSISLTGYLNALAVMESRGDPDSVEILNNIGALYHREAQTQKDFDTAKSYYDRALAAAGNGSFVGDIQTTVLYNLARLHEQTGQFSAAIEGYNSILERHPSYTDCYIRLAAVNLAGQGGATSAGFDSARSTIRKGIHVDRKSSLLMLGTYFFEDTSKKENLREARKSFEEVLQKADKHDHYALCSIGNIYLIIAKFDPKQKESHVKKALEFFDKAVRVDSKNAFGAVGVGICLAELGKFDQAREVFSQVLEGASNMATVSVNLAHVLVELGQPKLAMTHYERVLKKSVDQNAYVLQCLARACYIIGKSEKDQTWMAKCIDYLHKAIRSDPSKWSLFYDFALAKQQYAQIMNDQPSEKRSVAALKKALNGLLGSRRLFQSLGEKTEQHVGYDPKQAKERANYCKDVQRATEKKIHETTVLETQRHERLQAIRMEQQKLEQAEEEKKRLALEKEQAQREEIERKRREIMSKVQEENRRMRERAELEEDEEARKPKRKKAQESDESGEEEQDSGEKEKKKKRKRKEKSLLNKNANAEEGAPDFDVDAARVGKASNLSRAIIDSDDDE